MTQRAEDTERAAYISSIHNAFQIHIIVNALAFYAKNQGIQQARNEALALRKVYEEAQERNKREANRILARLATTTKTDASMDV